MEENVEGRESYGEGRYRVMGKGEERRRNKRVKRAERARKKE